LTRQLFHFPKIKHKRSEAPPAYSNYRLYKPYLRTEFYCTCVYCRMPDGPKGSSAFGVDHYCPQNQDTTLATTYSNLFYACNDCNAYKGKYWPSAEELEKGIFIPNPCSHVMFQHVQNIDCTFKAKTKAGKHLVDLLNLNNDRLVSYRRALSTLHASAKQEISDLQKLAHKATPEEKVEIETRINDLKSFFEGYL